MPGGAARKLHSEDSEDTGTTLEGSLWPNPGQFECQKQIIIVINCNSMNKQINK